MKHGCAAVPGGSAPVDSDHRQTGSGDFSIGSALWPGTSKLIEEMGELNQVIGKLIATAGSTDHWSGDLRPMLVEELADVSAAIWFFSDANLTPDEIQRYAKRVQTKLALFRKWHADPKPPTVSGTTSEREGA
jgi:hypothetical protein